MGVTYKLTEDVVAYILAQKQKSMDLSCRELVDLVAKEFNRVVSKSSVHEVLKEANITSQRGRKYKNKFKIPEEKKAELIASLPPAIVANFPQAEPSDEIVLTTPQKELDDAPLANEAPLTLRKDPTIIQKLDTGADEPSEKVIVLPALQESEDNIDFTSFLMQSVFYDLFPKPWGEVKTQDDFNAIDSSKQMKEAAYRKLAVANYKIELEDNSSYYVEARRHGLGRDAHTSLFPVSIETATMRMADSILNNIRPLTIKQIQGAYIDAAMGDFLKSMDNVPEKRISRILLLDQDQDVLIDFASMPKVKRTFIAGLQVMHKDVAMLIDKIPEKRQATTTYVNTEPVQFYSHEIFLAGNLLRGIVLVSKDNMPQLVLISNMDLSKPDQSIVLEYMHTFTLESFQAQQAVVPTIESGLILTQVMKIFGNIMMPAIAQHLSTIKVHRQFNKDISIATVVVPDGYEHIEQIKQACFIVNNLNIIDHAGRKIWARVG